LLSSKTILWLAKEIKGPISSGFFFLIACVPTSDAKREEPHEDSIVDDQQAKSPADGDDKREQEKVFIGNQMESRSRRFQSCK
jgi:hypothetical protein